MLQIHYFPVWPVKVIRDEGYLLIKLVERVANYPPTGSISG